jgi:O-antigen ligase
MMTSGGTLTAVAWRGTGTSAGPWTAAAIVLLLVGLAAFVVSPVLGVGVGALLVAPLFVLSPRYGLLVFAALLPFDAVSALGDGERALSLTRLVGLAVIGGWIVHLLAERRRVRLGRSTRWLVAYVGFAALSVVWATDPSVTLRALATLVQLLLLTVMAADVLREPADVRRVIDVMLVSTVAVSLLVLVQLPGGTKRATLQFAGESVNPNYLAATLVFPAVAAVGLGAARMSAGWWRLAAVVPIALALFLTGSRGGGIAFLGGVVVIGALRRRVGLGVAAGALALAVLLPVLVPQTTVDRLLNRYSAAEQDRLSGRMDIWRVAMAMVEDHPLQGTALGGFPDAFYQYMLTTPVDPYFARAHSRGNRASHNIYLGTLAELGLVGITLLAIALLAHGRSLWRTWQAALRQHDEARAQLTLALLGVFTSLVLFGSTIDLLGTKAPWIWLAMMQAVACAGIGARGRRVRWA